MPPRGRNLDRRQRAGRDPRWHLSIAIASIVAGVQASRWAKQRKTAIVGVTAPQRVSVDMRKHSGSILLALALSLLFAAGARGAGTLDQARSPVRRRPMKSAERVRPAESRRERRGRRRDRSLRALCLMALSRATEADTVIQSIVSNDPLYQPSATDAAPRVRAAFSAVRQRCCPAWRGNCTSTLRPCSIVRPMQKRRARSRNRERDRQPSMREPV